MTGGNLSHQLVNGLFRRDLQHLPGLEDVALQPVQLHDLGVSAAFAEVLLGDLPQRIAVLDRVRPAGGFGFRRDCLAHEGVIVLLHRRNERTPVGQDVLRTLLAGVEVLVRVNVRLGVKSVLFAEVCNQLGGGILTELAVADALDGDSVQIAADSSFVCYKLVYSRLQCRSRGLTVKLDYYLKQT